MTFRGWYAKSYGRSNTARILYVSISVLVLSKLTDRRGFAWSPGELRLKDVDEGTRQLR